MASAAAEPLTASREEIDTSQGPVSGSGGSAPNAADASKNSSLYVGDLDRDVSEAQLFDLFSQIGAVASIRVCRDAVTRRSLGYAYVNYNSTVDPNAAERALDALNYSQLSGRPMRIMWSHRDPSTRRSGLGNIFIKNLDKSIDNKALHDTFSAFGNILSCKVAMDAAGNSKGYGFVHFEKEEDAQSAIKSVNGMLVEGQKVFVGPFLKRSDRGGDRESNFTNVYVKNLSPDVEDDEALAKMFSEYGVVSSAVVMKDEEGKSKGFGFVNFEEPEGAHKAVDALSGSEIDGKELYVGRAQKKSEREATLKQKFDEQKQERIAKYQGMNLYIKNLTDEVDDAELRREFAPHGTITSAKVMRDAASKSKGFGFVCYSSSEEATKAVTAMNQHMLHGKPIYVALAQRHDVRRAQLEQQYQQRMLPHMMAGPMAPMGGPMAPGMFPPGPPMAPYMQAQRYMPRFQGPRGGPGMGYNPMMQGPMGMGMGMGMGTPGRGRGGPRMPFDFSPGAPQNGMMMGGRMGGRGMGGPGRGRGRMGAPDMGLGPMAPMMGGRGLLGGPMPGRGMPGRGRGMAPQMNGGMGPGMNAPPGGPGMQQALPAPPQQPQMAPMPVAASGLVPGQDGSQLTTAMLAAAAPEKQKMMLGERLFPLVSQQQPELAGKITGMLLEMDNSELLLLLESPEALESKIEEAITVLREHGALAGDEEQE